MENETAMLDTLFTGTGTDDRGLSTVVGAVLVVGIVVIIAGGLAVTLGGFGDDINTDTTTAQFTVDDDSLDAVSINHTGGGGAATGNIVIAANNASGDNYQYDASTFSLSDSVGDTWSEGESVTIDLTEEDVASDDDHEVIVYYDSGDGGELTALSDT